MATEAAHAPAPCLAPQITDARNRTDLLNRLKRAEGQLRGVQRMIEEGQGCMDIASQMAAVRKALDSAYVRMTVCFMQQELKARLGGHEGDGEHIEAVVDEMQELLGKLR